MAPLICTTNTQARVDYGIPIYATQSTDYRTSTGKNHDYIAPVPQEFDARVKLKVDPSVLTANVAIKNDVKSSYNEAYVPISDDDVLKIIDKRPKMFKASHCMDVKATRIMQERFKKQLVSPLKPTVSEMKDNYKLKYGYKEPTVPPPAVYAKCSVTGTERPLQPTIPPEQKGFWKHLDIYMTDNRLKFCAYTPEQMRNAKHDIVTCYAANGKWKGLKNPLPGPLTGNKSVYDKQILKFQYPPKFLSKAPKHVPNSGMQSEYKGTYVPLTSSDLFPYIHESGVPFDESLSAAGPWQYYAPPGMYCTEYCHTGTGFPVNSVVNTGTDKKYIPHKTCNIKVKKCK